MSLLARAVAPRALKSIDQVEMAHEMVNGSGYVPLENHQTWTSNWASADPRSNYIAVYQCVRVLSNVFAQLPLKLYRRRADGGKEDATDHPLYRTLHLQPNSQMTSFVWRKIAMRHLATWGNHYSEIVPDQMGRLQLWPIRPDRIEVEWNENGISKDYYYLSATGGRRLLRKGSIFHMQGQTTDGLVGYSPITELRRTLQLGDKAEVYGAAVFENGARPAVVLSHPKNLSDPAIKRLAAQMDELKGVRNQGKTVVLEEGMSITPVGFPPEDAQFLETRLTQHRLIYGAYGIPPHKVGDLERATFSNIEHQALEFIQDGAMPWFVNAEQEFSVQLIPEEDVFAEFLVDGYLRGDAKARAEALAIRWQHGTLSPDEWRAMENENPIEGGAGQQYFTAVNYAPIPAVEAEPAEAEPQPPPALTVIKSALRQFDCPDCGKLINRLAAPGTVGHCKSCKSEKTFEVA